MTELDLMLRPASWLVAAGRDPHPGAPLNVPLVPASTFILGERHEYSRDDGTPTWEALEEIVGGLEGGRPARFRCDGLERAQANASSLAQQLAAHPAVQHVRYPGLPAHPTHEIARRSMKGFGTIISFDVRGGAAAANAVCRQVRLIRHATSLTARCVSF